MLTKSRAQALLQHVDHLIEKYSESNPEVVKDLRELRTVLKQSHRRDNLVEFGKTALRISVLVKFIYDHWPGD